MAINLQVSNSLAQLAQKFCTDLKKTQISVFQPYYLVTQTDGMNNWLKFQLAENLGIAANYRFLKPNDLINQIYQTLGGEYLQPLSSENQSWLIYKILAEPDFISKFKYIAQYYADQHLDKDLKRLALAQKVADLFDQYQIYRADMINEWNNASLSDAEDFHWQKYIWIKAKNLAGDKIPDKTFISNYILKELKNPSQQTRLKNNMPAIYLFGLSVLTDFHIQLFHQVGQIINFYYYLLNPAPSVYWIEDVTKKRAAKILQNAPDEESYINLGNSLLTSWGKIIQNTFYLLFKNEQLLNSYENIAAIEPTNDTLLHQIQHQIYNNLTDEEINFKPSSLTDGTICINSCYTPAREIEALFNYLVSLINEKKEQLSSRDIVVMVSDIDAYAPYIRAVFSNAPYKFHFSIADESFSSNDTIAASLVALMEMNNQNMKAENVLQLLDFGYIKKRFDIDDIALIRNVIDSANIRFGIDGNNSDESIYVSWKYGLERIILGICMSGDEEYYTENDSLFPVDKFEGATAQQVIKFVHFVQVLIASIQERERSRSITDWVKYVDNLLVNLIFDPGENADEDYIVLIKQLEKYNALNNLLTEDLNYQIFSYSFLKTISGATRTGTFASGGITFCSLIPMRSIPFKVVALLGLNFDKFPRKENPVDFDLIRKSPKPGDRNVKENDKHLFLETLLSAQNYLYISYIGQNAKDNTSIPPSVLVDELIDYIQNKFPAIDLTEQLIRKHPLHSFSLKNSENGKLNYIEHIEIKEQNFFNKEIKTNDLEINEIKITSFINFFKNPFKAYFQKVLNIYYESDDVLLNDTELFNIDGLQEWNLKQQLLNASANELPNLKNRWVKTGLLPLKNMANVVLNDAEEKVEPIRKLVKQCIGNDVESVENINLYFEDSGIKITGDLSGIYGNKLVVISWSKSENRYLLEAYISYLIAQASNLNLKLHFISASKEKIFNAVEINSAQAKEKLIDLIGLYQSGHQKILSFYPDFNIKPKDIQFLDFKLFIKAVKDKLDNYNFPSNDKYIMTKFNEGFFNLDENFEEYKVNAELLLTPIAALFPDYYAK